MVTFWCTPILINSWESNLITNEHVGLNFQILGIQVHSGDVYDSRFTTDKLLTWSTKEIFGKNYWLAPHQKVGVGFILDLGQPTNIRTIQLVNTQNGHVKDRGTRGFQVFVSGSPSGPWTSVLSTSLPDSKNYDPVRLSMYNIQPISERFVRFNIVSYWGLGGGLQYFNVL